MSGDSVEIKQLLKLIAQRNQKAFDVFYHRFYDRVFRTAYYFLCDVESCREVVSDVFFSIWKMEDRLTTITNVESYLYIVTKNMAGRRLLAEEEHRQRHVSLSGISVYDAGAGAPADRQLEEAEMEKALEEAICALPEKCRIIFLMSREEGMDSRYIAECLNISDSTVRVQLKIALDKIVKYLKKAIPNISLSIISAMLMC